MRKIKKHIHANRMLNERIFISSFIYTHTHTHTYIYKILYSALAIPRKEGYRLHDCPSCFMGPRIYYGINIVLTKHNLDTPQRKRRERVWQTMELFYISPIWVNALTSPLTCLLLQFVHLIYLKRSHTYITIFIYHLSNRAGITSYNCFPQQLKWQLNSEHFLCSNKFQ